MKRARIGDLVAVYWDSGDTARMTIGRLSNRPTAKNPHYIIHAEQSIPRMYVTRIKRIVTAKDFGNWLDGLEDVI